MAYTVNGRPATKEEYDKQQAAINSLSIDSLASRNDRRANLPVSPGAEPPPKPPVKAETYNIKGTSVKDHRVKIRVPPEYRTIITGGYDRQLSKLQGIIFPYTPTISFQAKAEYAESRPLHSNFSIHFYQRSSITPIDIIGKFTVENRQDAVNFMDTQRLLIALTRMKFGLDQDAGAPPPVCRLEAYGDQFLKNVPVVITNFKIDYTEDVDYFEDTITGTSVPVRASVSVTCLPMYSRNEMQNFSTNAYLKDYQYKNKGYI